jgi:hypothetical protein
MTSEERAIGRMEGTLTAIHEDTQELRRESVIHGKDIATMKSEIVMMQGEIKALKPNGITRRHVAIGAGAGAGSGGALMALAEALRHLLTK